MSFTNIPPDPFEWRKAGRILVERFCDEFERRNYLI